MTPTGGAGRGRTSRPRSADRPREVGGEAIPPRTHGPRAILGPGFLTHLAHRHRESKGSRFLVETKARRRTAPRSPSPRRGEGRGEGGSAGGTPVDSRHPREDPRGHPGDPPPGDPRGDPGVRRSPIPAPEALPRGAPPRPLGARTGWGRWPPARSGDPPRPQHGPLRRSCVRCALTPSLG